MTPRTASRAAVLCAALALVAGCDSGEPDGRRGSASRAPDVVPTGSRPPAQGKGSDDPADVNGDGHRDLVVQVPVGAPREQPKETRLTVVFGSPRGPDPATRTLYDRRDLGLPTLRTRPGGTPAPPPGDPTLADLDDDGFPDFVFREAVPVDAAGTPRAGSLGTRPVEYVAWGGPGGPRRGARATELPLPPRDRPDGYEAPVMGDFDGDGRHDLAALREDGTALVIRYGPFTRAGVAARTERRPPADPEATWYSGLYADEVSTSGRPRVTGLFVHHGTDGEQSDGVYYAPGKGGIAATGRPVRAGNAIAFGDFDGDGRRDLAVGDDGSRNNEPGATTEPPAVDGSYAVYAGDGSVRTHRLPASHRGRFAAVDPDGDGRDGLLVARSDAAVLLDGSRVTGRLSRRPPARVDGRAIRGSDRLTRLHTVADFDGDHRDEIVLGWSSSTLLHRYGDTPIHWWVADGMSREDDVAFATRRFARPE
ncbi:FG-GAP repeat protein [Streptomyces longispororuber]|uniref:FG-GAP repeat protein n=1 Tax=Streptomyces longispororuber TaxID=68230 RepID=UPI00340D8043